MDSLKFRFRRPEKMVAARKVGPRGDIAESAELAEKHPRLLEIFDQLEAGVIDEEQAVEALTERRKRRYGRVGRLIEAFTS
jgi:hypothetical protein